MTEEQDAGETEGKTKMTFAKLHAGAERDEGRASTERVLCFCESDLG
jgi:hypothetical protein